MPRLTAEQWLELEIAYRAGTATNEELATKYGCHVSAIKQRAKKGGWIREPAETKRRMVEAKLSAPEPQTVQGQVPAAQPAVREILEAQADIDAQVLNEAARMFGLAIVKATAMVEASPGPSSLKDAVTAGRTATQGYKDVRGLNEKPPEESDFESAVRRLREAGEV